MEDENLENPLDELSYSEYQKRLKFSEYLEKKNKFLEDYAKGQADCSIENLGYIA